MIHLFNNTEYSPFLQLSELNTQLSQTNQLKYAASAQPTQKSAAFTQLTCRSEKKMQHFYSFNAGLKKTQLLRSFFKKAAEKPAFTQLLRRAEYGPHLRKGYKIYSAYKDFNKLVYILSYDVASGSEIMPCNKIDKPLVVYRFSGKLL